MMLLLRSAVLTILSNSDFTEDLEEAQWLLHDMGISHVVSASSSGMQTAKELESFVTCRYFDIPDDNMDALMVVLRRICDFLHTAIRNGGRVLVYCSAESRASVIVSAYRELSYHLVNNPLIPHCLIVMFSQWISAKAATNILRTGLFGSICYLHKNITHAASSTSIFRTLAEFSQPFATIRIVPV